MAVSSEPPFRQLTEDAPDIIFRYRLHPEPGLDYLNPIAATLTGYTRDELYADPDIGFNLIHPLDRRQLELLLHGDLPPQRPLTLRWVRKDGTLLWTELRNNYVYDEAGTRIAVEGIARDITAQREPEILFQSLLGAAPDAMVVTRGNGRILFVNQQLENLCGYKSAELLGQPVELLLPERFHDEHVAHRAVYGMSPRTRPMGSGLDLFARCKDGQEIPVEVSLSPLVVADEQLVIAAIRDVSERKQAEAALRLSEAHFRLLVDNVLEYAIYLVDSQGRVDSWNPGAERLFGYHPDEIIGRHFSRFFAREDQARGRPQQSIEMDIATGQSEIEGWRVRKDGSRFWARVVTTPIWEGPGKLRGYAKVVNDITERRRTRLERARLLAEEQRARTATEAVLRMRDEFLAFASHDLRNVIAAISLHLQLLRRLELPTLLPARQAFEVAEDLAAAEDGITRITALVDELRDVAHLQMGEPISLHRQPVDLISLVEQVVAGLQRTAGHCRLDVRALDQAIVSHWDRQRLDRVLVNLLTNAIKYSPSDSAITLTVARESDAWAVLTVEDHGIGIPAADLPHVLDGFKRGGNVAGRIAGSGLGLAGSRKIVEQHGGTLTIESQEGRGTMVTIRLPL